MPEALIWGANGGIGSALVARLKQDDWTVFAAARDESRIPSTADHTYRFDASHPPSITGVASLIAPDSDGVDLMVYAVGALRNGLLDRISAEDYALVMTSNVTGAWLAAQASLPLMKAGGHLVFIGAYIDHLILPKMGVYAAAKAALAPLVSVMAKENRQQKFTLLRPGPVDTPFWQQAPFKLPKDAKAPPVIAEAILQRYHAGEAGELNL